VVGRLSAILAVALRKHVKDVVLVMLGVGLAFLVDARIAARQNELASDLADRAEVLENVRFIRQVQADGSALKPFAGLSLTSASLGGLSLPCENLAERQGCADFTGANLSHADLAGADLRGATLKEAILGGTNFFRTNLEGADLRGAAGSADLMSANLRGASLRDSLLLGASMRGADLRDADLTNAWIGRSTLAAADLRGADLSGVDLSGLRLQGTNLLGARLDQKPLRDRAICFSETTVWPAGIRVPEPADPDGEICEPNG
jgi:uncharacterized protein YjbI with pentapeptide repeats